MTDARDGLARLPFLFGAQYYRAPTPEESCWEADHRRMRELGFNAVKYWVQWRWSHRDEGEFDFSDLDRLMDLAAANSLAVTLNTIFDVAPHWLYELHPDAQQVANDGTLVRPVAVGHRQIGGFPGPCYNHPEALEARMAFLRAAVLHFRGHPAMAMWDVWNEPEQCGVKRLPDAADLVCYCGNCRAGFLRWLEAKYGTPERLDAVWGRSYRSWDDVELPRTTDTYADFIDWREFHLDTMAVEAAWRLAMARELDPSHVAYLHVVPNTMEPFNSVTCVDDFDMARACDVFAGTTFGGAVFSTQLVSAARGKVCYNVECHINHGQTSMHPKIQGLREILKEFVPQIGQGIRGFLFWQYRAEVLGREAPAWGLVKLDGSDRPATEGARAFWERLAPHAESLLACRSAPAEIAVWKSRKNELFHFCVHGNLHGLADAVAAYSEALYGANYRFRYVDGRMLAGGELEGVRLLIMPSPYCLAEAEARALDAWVRDGGVLLCEAHLGGYDATTGRHSRTVPGCGLSAAWGLHEFDTTSSHHLDCGGGRFDGRVADDVGKALAHFGTAGGRFFPIRMDDGTILSGCERYAVLRGDALAPLGTFDGTATCVARVRIGRGDVFYVGSNAGEGSRHAADGFVRLVRRACEAAGVSPQFGLVQDTHGSVRVDAIGSGDDVRFMAVDNRTHHPQLLTIDGAGRWRGIYTGNTIALSGPTAVAIEPDFVDLLVREGGRGG